MCLRSSISDHWMEAPAPATCATFEVPLPCHSLSPSGKLLTLSCQLAGSAHLQFELLSFSCLWQKWRAISQSVSGSFVPKARKVHLSHSCRNLVNTFGAKYTFKKTTCEKETQSQARQSVKAVSAHKIRAHTLCLFFIRKLSCVPATNHR